MIELDIFMSHINAARVGIELFYDCPMESDGTSSIAPLKYIYAWAKWPRCIFCTASAMEGLRSQVKPTPTCWQIWNILYRLTSACQKKCISPKYKEGELTKGESVCLDRCVAKYLEIHERIGKKLTAMSAQDEQLMAQMQSR